MQSLSDFLLRQWILLLLHRLNIPIGGNGEEKRLFPSDLLSIFPLFSAELEDQMVCFVKEWIKILQGQRGEQSLPL